MAKLRQKASADSDCAGWHRSKEVTYGTSPINKTDGGLGRKDEIRGDCPEVLLIEGSMEPDERASDATLSLPYVLVDFLIGLDW